MLLANYDFRQHSNRTTFHWKTHLLHERRQTAEAKLEQPMRVINLAQPLRQQLLDDL